MIALCSGGFSILHVGHLDLFEQAAKYGDVVVALNSDKWIMRKYGFVSVNWSDRKRLLESLRIVHKVVSVNDDDGTVCDAIILEQPDFFVNGGDRQEPNQKEHNTCTKFGVKEVYVDTRKVHSSDIMNGGIK
jgi:cytidyltransferase-like protein